MMHSKSLFLPLFITSVLLTSCGFHCSVGSTDEEKKSSSVKENRPVHKDGAEIYNGIDITVEKVKLIRAYLADENGKKLPNDNFVFTGQNIKLILIVDSGGVEVDRKVSVGISQKVFSEDGQLILDKPDLFSEHTGGISPDDASILGLTLKIGPSSGPSSYTVRFRIWDKNGDGEVEGKYIIYTK